MFQEAFVPKNQGFYPHNKIDLNSMPLRIEFREFKFLNFMPKYSYSL